jgi:HYDIN/CFA65/VesB family protein
MRMFPRSLPILLAAISFVAGCSDSGGGIGKLRGKLDTQDLIDFGDVQVGITQSYTLVVKNSGNGTFSVTSIQPADTFTNNNYEFKLSDNEFPLAASQSKNVIVTFQPFTTMMDPVTSSFTINTDIPIDDKNSGKVSLTVNVKGRGVATGLIVDPNPIDFDKVLVGSSRTLDGKSPANPAVKITNKLSIAVDVIAKIGADGKPQITSQGSGRFELVGIVSGDMILPVPQSGSLVPPNADGSPALLQPMQSIQVALRYTPDPSQDDREDHGRWTIANCPSPLCEQQIPLKGIGTNAAVECMPPDIAFGQVNPNVVRTLKTTCTNIASETVNITGWNLGPGTTREFTVKAYNGTPSSLVAGATFEVEAKFSPNLQSVGANPMGSILIAGRNPRANRNLTPTRIGLTGTAGGPKIEVTPAMLNFGNVAIGTTSKKRIIVQNTGYGPLTISNVDPDGARVGAFTSDFSGGASIQAGMSKIIEITFRPTLVGSVTSTVVITSDDGTHPTLDVGVTGSGVNLPPCNYTLSPTTINFGIIQVLHATTQGLRIDNNGTNDCLVNDVTIVPGSSPAFGLEHGNESGVMIPAGMSHTIIVNYAPPREGTDMGNLGFYISDPMNSNPTVPLHGVGSNSALVISPNELNFGKIGLNCSTRDRTINIFNTGNNPTTIDRIERPAGVSSEFEIGTLPMGIPAPPGAVVQPGSSISFNVKYHANNIGVDTGSIDIWEHGRADPYVVPLYGEGSNDPTNEDDFTQLSTPKVDIVMAVDNSCSMADKQMELATNFQSFIQFAVSQALDYHISVVTTDVDTMNDGGKCPSPLTPQRPANVDEGACGYFADGNFDASTADPAWRIVKPDTQPDPATAFAALVHQGTNGSVTENGIRASYQALSPPILTGWNNNFIRTDAYLAIIAVSDADDQSNDTVDFYTNYFLAIKGFRDTNLFSFSAISQLSTDTCGEESGGGGSPRYHALADRTGGIFESICTNDWAQALQNLGLSVFGYKSRFFLSNTPVQGSIVVKVDGMVIQPMASSGQVRWTYDPATNSVQFAPLAIPEPGSQIAITYTAECL